MELAYVFVREHLPGLTMVGPDALPGLCDCLLWMSQSRQYLASPAWTAAPLNSGVSLLRTTSLWKMANNQGRTSRWRMWQLYF